MTVIAFTGTATGNTYSVGQVYTMGDGREFVARPDGTFQDIHTGRTLVGSSQSAEALFTIEETLPVGRAMTAGSSGQGGSALPYTGGGAGAVPTSSSPAQGAVSSPGAPASGAVPASFGDVGWFPVDPEPYKAFGQDIHRSPWFSPAETVEEQHGDLASSGWGVLTLPADVIYTIGVNQDWIVKQVKPFLDYLRVEVNARPGTYDGQLTYWKTGGGF